MDRWIMTSLSCLTLSSLNRQMQRLHHFIHVHNLLLPSRVKNTPRYLNFPTWCSNLFLTLSGLVTSFQLRTTVSDLEEMLIIILLCPPDVTNITSSSTKTRDELLRTPKCKTFMTWLKKKPNLQCGTIMTRDNLLSAGLWFFWHREHETPGFWISWFVDLWILSPWISWIRTL